MIVNYKGNKTAQLYAEKEVERIERPTRLKRN